MSLTSVDLPDPDTPVTHTNPPSGIETSTFLRLFSAAPLMTMAFLAFNRRRVLGVTIALRPER
jgi:hypothetical protein